MKKRLTLLGTLLAAALIFGCSGKTQDKCTETEKT